MVVGGGPAGMMAAISASRHHRVSLLEGGKELGKKLLITGGGRCNVTFKGDQDFFFQHVFPNPNFLRPAFKAFNNEDLLDFFKGIDFKVEGQKVYPSSDRASTIRDYLVKELEKRGVEVLYEHRVEEVIIENNRVQGVLLGDTCFELKHLILAPGGRSYPGTGSDGRLLKKIPVKKTPSYGVLVGIETKEDLSDLSGISIQAKAIYKKKAYRGELLFTHKGISGPLAFTLSQYYDKKVGEILVDLLPDVKEEMLRHVLFMDKRPLTSSLSGYLPKALIHHLAGSDVHRHQLKKNEREELVKRFKALLLTVKQLGSTESAIVTRGGVELSEIDPSTMKAKGIEGLSFAGECVDLDGSSGGFNLQIAFSTGYLAGSNL